MNNLKLNSSQQTFNFLDISLIWAGINICLPSFMLGGILVPNLSPFTAIIVTILGNSILAILIYLMALPGIQKGYSAALMSNYIFGTLGSKFTSLLVIISMLGWSAILLELTGQAILEITSHYNLPISYNINIVFIGILIILSSQAGAEKMTGINKINVPILLILIIWIGFIIFRDYNIYEVLKYNAVGDINYYTALDLVIGGTIAGVFVSSDINRYAKNRKSLSLGVFIGIVPITLGLAAIGILASLATESWNPVSIIMKLGMGIPALILVVLSSWTTIQVSLYSGSLATISIFPKLSRKKITVILGSIIIIFSIYRILANFEIWLLLLDNLFSPIIAIALYKIISAKFSAIKLDMKAIIAIIAGLLFKNLITINFSSTLLTMLYTIIAYYILDKIYSY